MSPTNQTVAEGKASNISCKITAGVAMPTLSWSLKTKSLPPATDVTAIEDGSVLQEQNTKKRQGRNIQVHGNKQSKCSNCHFHPSCVRYVLVLNLQRLLFRFGYMTYIDYHAYHIVSRIRILQKSIFFKVKAIGVVY